MTRGLANVRLFDGEATRLLDWLPPASLDAVDLLYPDPWPKTRHWKRRFVNDDNLDRLARVLKPGGEFRFASDIASYVEWTLRHVSEAAPISSGPPNAPTTGADRSRTGAAPATRPRPSRPAAGRPI